MFLNYIDRIIISKGDITKEKTDAIVNAANSSLLGGGGVDGAIHRAGGGQILEECRQIVAKIGKLETGKAVITSGGALPAKHVIHTVGPIWHGGYNNEEKLLADAYRNSLRLALDKQIKTIAFPSISAGAYGFPKELAAQIAFSTVKEVLMKYREIEKVKFVCFDDYTYNLYAELIRNDISENIRPLFDFIPYFEDENKEKVCWCSGEKCDDKTAVMTYPRYDEGVIKFVNAVENSGIMMYDYLDYLQKLSGLNNDKFTVIKNAELNTLRAILTYYIRQERFCDGLWAEAIKNKIFLNVLYQAKELIEDKQG